MGTAKGGNPVAVGPPLFFIRAAVALDVDPNHLPAIRGSLFFSSAISSVALYLDTLNRVVEGAKVCVKKFFV